MKQIMPVVWGSFSVSTAIVDTLLFPQIPKQISHIFSDYGDIIFKTGPTSTIYSYNDDPFKSLSLYVIKQGQAMVGAAVILKNDSL